MLLTSYVKSQPPMKVDLIYDQNGDWAALYVDGVCRFQGHSIRDEDFMSVIKELGAEINDYQESDFSDTGTAPGTLEEVTITYG